MYQDEIARIAAHLGMSDRLSEIEWVWVNKPYLRKRRGFTTWGDYTHREVRPRIRIATGRSYESVVRTIAHEMRHWWQYRNGVLTAKLEGMAWSYTWTGSDLWPPAQKFKRMAYLKRPHERDARGYENVAWDTLFNGKPKPPRTADLFLSALF